MAAPGANIRFMGVDSSLVDLTEKKSSKGNNKTEYFSLTDLNTNFANTDLTFTAARAHNTDGNTLELTTDGGNYAESWLWLGTPASTSRAEFGYANTWHRYTATELNVFAGNDEKVAYKVDGMYHHNAAAPSAADANTYVQYASDIVAGNSAPHFKTENGDIVKLYAQDNTVSASGFVANTSGISDDTATWGGFTIGQVVKALLNAGLLK